MIDGMGLARSRQVVWFLGVSTGASVIRQALPRWTYQVMTAVAYYSGLRPSEVVMLRAKALHLLAKGWGRIDVTEADVSFDEPGEPKTGPRSVPIPRTSSSCCGAGSQSVDTPPTTCCSAHEPACGRPRRTGRARCAGPSRRSTGHRCGSTDCRHAAATTWLKAGVPLGEVARHGA